MKIVSIVVEDENGVQQTLMVKDGTALLVCDEDKILTQKTNNAAINLELIKHILEK